HQTHWEQEDLTAALNDLETVRALVDKAVEKGGQAQDRQWEAENKVEKSYTELKNYLGQAAALDRRARNALDEGDWQAARKHVLERVTGHPRSPQARMAHIPGRFDTRPTGAEIHLDGKALTHVVDGSRVPITTPAIVFCPNRPRLEI